MRRPHVVPFACAPLLVALLLVTSACDDGSPGTAPTTSSTSTSTTRPPSTEPPEGGELPAPPCLAGPEPFQEDGNAGTATSTRSDATLVTEIRWTLESGCERLVIGFSTAEGAPAVAPPTIATSLLRESAVLRINLGPEVTGSAIAEQLVDTELVDRIDVVRSARDALFVDVHLQQPALARVTSQGSPARAVIDVRPGGSPYPGRARRTGDLVVVEPVIGPVTYPFSLNGYLRTGADSIEAVLDGSGEQVTESAAVAPQGDTWGGFVVLFPDGPEGRITIGIGDIELRISAS